MPNRQNVGSIAANDARVILTIDDQGSAIALIAGTWAGTLEAQVSADGVTWATVNVFDVAGNTAVRSWTVNGQYMLLELGGVTAVSIHAVAWTSGTATIRISATGAQFSARPAATQTVIATANTAGDPIDLALVRELHQMNVHLWEMKLILAHMAPYPGVITEPMG